MAKNKGKKRAADKTLARRKKAERNVESQNDISIAKSLFITLVIVALYRLGSALPVPCIPYQSLVDMYGSSISNGTALGATMSVLNVFAGGSLKYIGLFSLSIMPYITATIIMQVMGMSVPKLHDLQREGETGMNKINQYARYLTLGLSLLNAIGYFFLFRTQLGISFATAAAPEWMMIAMFILSLVGGSMLLMYMGEKITDTRLFQGASVLICVNIMASIPTAFYESVMNTADGARTTAIIVIALLLMVPFLILMEMGQRRIPITYARQKAVDTKFSRQTTYLPIKAMAQGVVPIIFASAFIYVPVQLSLFFPDNEVLGTISQNLSSGWVSWVVQTVLIILFSFFYVIVEMRPDNISDGLAKSGAFVSDPRIPQGPETTDYIRHVTYRIVMPASIILAALAVVPNILLQSVNNPMLSTFGGTSLLIVIGVICQCIMAIDSQKTMDAYANGRFKRRKRRATFGESYTAESAEESK